MNHDPLGILKAYFKHPSFRPQQEEIIRAVLEGKDCLALFPTGGGKSICFQVPAMAKKGLCLVISPLVALMKDQVENLRRKGITAFAIQSGMSRKEVTNTLRLAAESNCKFLYVSPERLETNLFREFLPAIPINLIAVDEAHCISQWGYDFRPSYLRLAALREELPGAPVLALTASATPEVQKDICEKLHFNRGIVFNQPFERPGLSYSVFNTDSKAARIAEILQKVGGSGLVYCKTRRRTREISEFLIRNGISADFYHAGIPREERDEKQDSWIKDKTRVMVCTNAFGMGIDKADVRTVIHAEPPDCLENYCQESGRAGRDGKKAFAVLLYNPRDLYDLETRPEIHFPAPEKIRLVYRALMNYLQIPEGSGEGSYFDFDLFDFSRRFKLELPLVTHSLKALESAEWIAMADQAYLPAKALFTADREHINEFEKKNPGLESLIDLLLRTYGGIRGQAVAIQEKAISYALGKDKTAVIAELRQLHRHGIIRYTAQKEGPQLYFNRNRVRVEDFNINESEYNKRKEKYRIRVVAMSAYLNDAKNCRSRIIAGYFGSPDTKPCGICDHCLKQKNTKQGNKDFAVIQQDIKYPPV